GESAVPGLYAVGEAAGGVHGANRLDSNAIPETQVFGARAGQAAALRRAVGSERVPQGPAEAWEERLHAAVATAEGTGADYAAMRKDLQSTMWQALGIVRTKEGMERGLADVGALAARLNGARPAGVRSLMLHSQMASSLLVARACLAAALAREESR